MGCNVIPIPEASEVASDLEEQWVQPTHPGASAVEMEPPNPETMPNIQERQEPLDPRPEDLVTDPKTPISSSLASPRRRDARQVKQSIKDVQGWYRNV